MTAKRKIEIFSAGCGLCEIAVQKVRNLACPNCEVIVLDMNDDTTTGRAEMLGVKAVPAVAIEGVLIPPEADGSLDFHALAAAGLGQPLD